MNTVISVRTDKKIKDEATEMAKSAGISLSTVINSYLRQIVSARRIEIYAPEPMTPKLDGLIAEIEAELKAGKVSKEFTNHKDFLADLKK